MNVKASEIYKLLGTKDGGDALRSGIAPSMVEYRRALEQGDRVRPVNVECDGSFLVIAASHLARLCEAFLAKKLDVAELGYLATALDRAPDFKFVSKVVEECAFLLSSSEAHGPPSHEAVTAIHRVLRERVV